MSQDLVPADRRRRREDDYHEILNDHLEEDRRQFRAILDALGETKTLVTETKESVADALAFFSHAKWFVKLVTVVGGAVVAIVTIFYMLHEIAKAEPDVTPGMARPSHIAGGAEVGHR